MKTADRVRANGLCAPFTLGRHKGLAAGWLRSAHEIRAGLETCKVIVADGWTCPSCDYTQNWAWEWMADWTWEAAKIVGFKYPKVIR